jgi:transposase InsO family protein
VRDWSTKTKVPKKRFIGWIGISESKFFDWQNRYGKVNEHNGWISRDHWLTDAECEAIIAYWTQNPEEGYRRLTYMMLDEDIVAVSASSVYRVLKNVGAFDRWKATRGSSQKGTGFKQPAGAHSHWHTDISYVKIREVFYYLITVIDGWSRSVVAWDIRESMTTADVQIVVQKAHEAHPEARPRLISDNGGQYISKDFKEFIGQKNFTHVTTAPAYPESNGKQERFFRTVKEECLRPQTPLDVDDARRVVSSYIDHYNGRRLHSALGYITPADKLAGRADEIFAERDRKLEEAREKRAEARRKARQDIRAQQVS